MRENLLSTSMFIGFLVLAVFLNPTEANAYVGPGPGLSFITTLLGFLLAIFTSLFVVIFYPIRKFLKRKKEKKGESQGAVNKTAVNEMTSSEEKNQ